MTDDLAAPSVSYVVVRTAVPQLTKHREYLHPLRTDFWFSCAYCTISEAEGAGVGFEIDHYEPESSRPDLAAIYANLMYSCQHCNSRKWKICPPSDARAKGLRFFKADVDNAPDHFRVGSNDLIVGKSDVGTFTIKILDLNRAALVKLRAIRRRIAVGLEEVAFGLRALKDVPLDRMSSEQKLRFSFTKHELECSSARIDDVLKKLCRSPLLDGDPSAATHTAQRRAHLQEYRAQFPQKWWIDKDPAPKE